MRGGDCSPLTTVRWGEGDEGLRRSSVIRARQVLALGLFQDPGLDPVVLADAVQRVPRQEEPFWAREQRQSRRIDRLPLGSFLHWFVRTHGYVELKF